MWHSGTLAGAKQGVLFGMRGIAFSAPTLPEEPDFELLAPWVERVLGLLLPADDLKLVNVNFPATAPLGLQWTRQSVRQYDGQVVPGRDPMGRPHFWFSVKPLEAAEEGTDRWAVQQGHISMTPLRLDLTHEKELADAAARIPL
jgi:5'-nucleotidase